MNYKVLCSILFISIFCTELTSQEYTKKDSILNVKIVPENLTECFEYLDIIYKPLLEERNGNDPSFHFGTGLWIRNNWLNKGPLKSYFKSYNYKYYDNISSFIGKGYTLYLNGEIDDPEQYMKSCDRKVQFIIDGKLLILDTTPDNLVADQIECISVKKKIGNYYTERYKGIKKDNGLIIVTSKLKANEFDQKLSSMSKAYRDIKKTTQRTDIKFICKKDTLNFYDILGDPELLKIKASKTDKELLIIE